MCCFIVRVQAAAVYFSLCLAWIQLDPNQEQFHQNLNYKDISTRRTLGTLEQVENFTEFLQKKQQDAKNILEEQARARIPYVVNFWSNPDQEETISSTKDTITAKYDDKIDNLYYLQVDTNPDVVFKFSTKKTLAPMRNTIFYERTNKFRVEDIDGATDPIYNILNEKNMRKFGDDVTEMLGDASNAINPEIQLANIYKQKTTIDENKNLLKHIDALAIITNASNKNFDLMKITQKIINPPLKNISKPKIQPQLKIFGARKMEQNKYDALKQMVEKGNKSVTCKNAQTNKPKAVVKTTSKTEDDHKIKFEKIINRENQILDLLKKQMTLLEQVALFLGAKEVKPSLRAQDDFDSLLEELDLKRQKVDANLNLTQNAINSVQEKVKIMYSKSSQRLPASVTSVSTKQNMLPTIRTVIDETQVKKALKNDAYVQRILKMAKRKRDEYMKQAKGNKR